MESSKISAMMNGKTLEKNNIIKMYNMVQNASDVEEKKNVKKHSVLFVGQLPLIEQTVDLEQTRRILNASMPYDEVEDVLTQLLEALTTQKLLLEEDGTYKVNMQYEKTIIKAKKIARAYQLEQEKKDEADVKRAKKMYQRGTKLYNAGSYEEALQCFFNAAEAADYRMAYYSIGTMYYQGRGVKKSSKEALTYVRKALILGLAIAKPLEEEILADMNA